MMRAVAGWIVAVGLCGLAAGAGTWAGFALLAFVGGQRWPVYTLGFLAASASGGVFSGLTALLLRPRGSALLSASGPALFWIILLSSPNPWLREMPLTWGEIACALTASFLTWKVARQVMIRRTRPRT